MVIRSRQLFAPASQHTSVTKNTQDSLICMPRRSTQRKEWLPESQPQSIATVTVHTNGAKKSKSKN